MCLYPSAYVYVLLSLPIYENICLCVCESCSYLYYVCALKTWIHIYLYRSLSSSSATDPKKKIKEILDTDFSIICFSVFHWDYSLLVDRHTNTHTHTATKISIFELHSSSSYSSPRRRIFRSLDFFRVPFAARKHIINFLVCFSFAASHSAPSDPIEYAHSNLSIIFSACFLPYSNIMFSFHLTRPTIPSCQYNAKFAS